MTDHPMIAYPIPAHPEYVITRETLINRR